MAPKILFVLHLPPPVHGAAMVGKYIQDSDIINNRFSCHFINLSTADSLEDIGKVGLKKIAHFCYLIKNIIKEIKVYKPDLVYVTPNAKGGAFYKDFVVIQILKFMGCKVLAHYHNKGVNCFSDSKLNNWLYKIFFNNLNVLLLGEVLYGDVAKYVPLSKVGFCGNGLPELTEEENKRILDNHRRLINNTTDRINILYLSNMMAEKGVWTLVDACKILKDKGISFKCTFVGGWKDITEEVFIKKVVELGLQAEINAVGAVFGAEKEKFWLDADVFVFPSFYHNECFPLVLLEAMQHALPCISTEEGAIRDIIDNGETGFVVNARNPDVLASKIIELANAKQKRLDMGLKGYQKFKEQYTLKVFENRMCEILEQLTLDR